MKQSFADVSDEKYGRSKNLEKRKVWKITRKFLVRYTTTRAQKRNIGKTGEDEREREGRGNWVKKLNVSPFACKHDRSSGFLYRFWYWRTPCGIVFISGRPFCVLLRPFVTGRNRPVLHFTCRACHATLLVQWVKEDRQKSGISARQIITITGNRYRSGWETLLVRRLAMDSFSLFLFLLFYFGAFLTKLNHHVWIWVRWYGWGNVQGVLNARRHLVIPLTS